VNFNSDLELAPEHAFSLTGLGLIAQKQGELKSAADYYRRAVSADPSDIHYLLLSRALRQAGLTAEAERTEHIGMEKSSDWDVAQREVEKLLQE
jgi:uncharacterized protein HemY